MATVLVCICRTFQGCSRKVIYQICEWMAIIDFLLSPINYYLPCTPAEMTHCKYSRFQKSVLDLDGDGDLMIYCFFFSFLFFVKPPTCLWLYSLLCLFSQPFPSAVVWGHWITSALWRRSIWQEGRLAVF